jgi:uncharacterized protein YecT (DUF1311 family)
VTRINTKRFDTTFRKFTLMSRRDLIHFVTIGIISVVSLFSALHAQTQSAMNEQARRDFQRADADLNKAYQSVLAKLPTVESKQKLREAQRAWVVSRDAEAAREAKEAEGGSMAPSIRYETMTRLTRERINELKNMLDHRTESEPKSVASSVTPSPVSTPESSSEHAQSVSEPEQTPSPSSGSVSPDTKWEYKCAEYGLDQCAPEIVQSGTTEVVLDLDEEQEVHGPEARQAEVIWAPDSKRFAFNYSPLHAHHTVFQSVAFYQLRGDKWVALRSPAAEESKGVQLTQLGHSPKDFNPRRCAPDRDVLKVRKWTDANTAILYAPCYGRTSNELEAGFLFALKFDTAGKWKVVDTHRMSKKELEAEQ